MTTPDLSKQPQSKRRFPDPIGHLLFWPIAIGGIALDLWSKSFMFNWLPTLPGQEYIVIKGFLNFILRENPGAAFSIFFGQRVFLTSISMIATVAVVTIFLFAGLHRRVMQIALGCMTAGIVGNGHDRAFNNGLVRDFIDVTIPFINYVWPTFNVADSMLCIGVGLLILTNLTAPSDQKPALPQTAAR